MVHFDHVISVEARHGKFFAGPAVPAETYLDVARTLASRVRPEGGI